MKIRFKTWQICLVLLLSALLPVCLVTSLSRTTEAQAKYQTADIKPDVGICKGHHQTLKDFYQNVRLLPPSTVLEVLGNRVNYAYTDSGIELGSVELEGGYSVVPKDFSATSHSGCFGIMLCDLHKVALHIEALPQTQCGVVKQ